MSISTFYYAAIFNKIIFNSMYMYLLLSMNIMLDLICIYFAELWGSGREQKCKMKIYVFSQIRIIDILSHSNADPAPKTIRQRRLRCLMCLKLLQNQCIWLKLKHVWQPMYQIDSGYCCFLNWLSNKICPYQYLIPIYIDSFYDCIQSIAWTHQTITKLMYCHTYFDFNHKTW